MLNSFTITAIGNVGKDLELVGEGERAFTKISLIGNDRFGDKESATSLQFTAFGTLAEILVRHVRKGDQLFLEGYVKNNTWVDLKEQRHYDNSFIISGFKFGAPGKIKRAEIEQARSRSRGDEPTAPAPEETPPRARANGRTRRGKPSQSNGGGAAASP